MKQQEIREPWPIIKTMPLEQLEQNQWKLFNPTRPLPAGLKWNRVWNSLTGGRTARHMLRGRFPGGPRAAAYYAPQWFRFAAHSVAIRATPDALFQRAMNGTINAGGDAEFHTEYQGYDANGNQVRYDYTYGFIDAEVIKSVAPELEGGDSSRDSAFEGDGRGHLAPEPRTCTIGRQSSRSQQSGRS
jgi:hypothetical protein